MALQFQTFTSLVQNQAASAQGASATLLDLTVGSVLRATFEANASIALWEQQLIIQTLGLIRAQTATGIYLDTWMADFNLFRLPAVSASGTVTFSRLSAGIAALIPVGALVKTLDGTQIFVVTADTTNAAWSVAQNGYVLPAISLAIAVPVLAVVGGVTGNVQQAAIGLIASPIPSIDRVTNSLAFSNGVDPESDAALRARFVVYIAGLSKGTEAAIASAIENLSQGLTFSITENVDASGNYRPGNFVVTVNDGTGVPPASTLAIVQAAIEAVRPITSTVSVRAPLNVMVDIALSIVVSAGYSKPGLLTPVASAIEVYVEGLRIGQPLPFSRISQIAYSVSPGITNVTSVTLNGNIIDITPTAFGVVTVATVVVS